MFVCSLYAAFSKLGVNQFRLQRDRRTVFVIQQFKHLCIVLFKKAHGLFTCAFYVCDEHT